MTKSSAAPIVSEYFHGLGYELDWESHVTTIEEFANAPFDVYIAEQKVGDLVIVPPRRYAFLCFLMNSTSSRCG